MSASDPISPTIPPTLKWIGDVDGHLVLLDQTRLPEKVRFVECRDVQTVHEAIRSLRVRGAPAIGIAAAYGICLALHSTAVQGADEGSDEEFFQQLVRASGYLASSRPTAVNLFWAVERMEAAALALRGKAAPHEIMAALLREARAIHDEDRQMCYAIGRNGQTLLRDGQGVLTHCNAGGLATSEYGTALAVLFAAHEAGKRLDVYVDETRPLLQGSRLTAWELVQRGISATVICDSMAAQVMREGRAQAVVIGADRIARNGDTANKIGSYGVAVLAAAHKIPFYVAAPSSTFDRSIASGAEIPIEQRAATEITHGFGRPTAPEGIAVYNPAFDVTPAQLITAIICERGIIQPVTGEQIAVMLG